jgi:hypothetical protein
MNLIGLSETIALLIIPPRICVFWGSGTCDKRFPISSYFGAILSNVFDNIISLFVKSSIGSGVDDKCGWRLKFVDLS